LDNNFRARRKKKKERKEKEKEKRERKNKNWLDQISSSCLLFQRNFPPSNINLNSKLTQERGEEGCSFGKIGILVVMCCVFYIGVEYG